LESKKLPSRSKIKLRSKGRAAYHFTPTQIDVTYSKIAIERLGKRLMPKHATEQEARGVTASPGIAQGPVKIIEHSDDLAKIELGDIFIARYTFPTFTPYMQKSAAVVTDEGGITSHAAIVSREMNKPCIVGTRIATKIFKDGDVVEVDANEGIVRKL
jgi:pyruvate,water dikinase